MLDFICSTYSHFYFKMESYGCMIYIYISFTHGTFAHGKSVRFSFAHGTVNTNMNYLCKQLRLIYNHLMIFNKYAL